MYVGIFAKRKISPILPPNLIGENIIKSRIKDCIEDMATFTAFAKKKNFFPQKFSAIKR